MLRVWVRRLYIHTSGSKVTMASTRQKDASCLDEKLRTKFEKSGMSCTRSVSSRAAKTSSTRPTAATNRQSVLKIDSQAFLKLIMHRQLNPQRHYNLNAAFCIQKCYYLRYHSRFAIQVYNSRGKYRISTSLSTWLIQCARLQIERPKTASDSQLIGYLPYPKPEA